MLFKRAQTSVRELVDFSEDGSVRFGIVLVDTSVLLAPFITAVVCVPVTACGWAGPFSPATSPSVWPKHSTQSWAAGVWMRRPCGGALDPAGDPRGSVHLGAKPRGPPVSSSAAIILA